MELEPPPAKRQKRSESPSPELAQVPTAPSDLLAALKTTSSESDTYGWVSCSKNNDVERLATKEKAVEQALEFCAKLSVMLISAFQDIQADSEDAVVMGQDIIENWLSEYEKILFQHRSYKVLVGVEGPTGAGKSSFLGSLLGIQELLPSGQEAAATAVVGRVMWNHDDRPGNECRAAIIFRNQSDVENDLGLLLGQMNRYQEIDDAEYDDEEQRIQDLAVARGLIDHELPKVRAVWGLRESVLNKHAKRCGTDDGRCAEVKKIINSNLAALGLMNEGIRNLHSSKPEELSSAIKPFLDSTKDEHGKGSSFSAWPLVKMVNIFVKADILKSGINLVDLPGCGDAVDSRAEVAQRFRQNLDVRMVVAPICRAADEKQGQALMKSGYEEAQMRLNGKLNSRGLCVVLSKMDDITVDTYIKGNRELKKDAEVLKKQDRLTSLLEEKKELNNTYNSLQKKKWDAEVSSRKAVIEHEARSKPTSEDPDGEASQYALKKAREAERAKDQSLSALEDALRVLRDFDDKKRALMTEIDQSNSWLHHRAIQTRNAHVQERIHGDFLESQAKNDTDDTPHGAESECWLSVLPVSTKAFWQIEKNTGPMPGFPNMRCTGIPAAKQWLHHATLERRESHLNTVLINFNNLMMKLRSYSQEQCQGKEFSFTKNEVEAALADTHAAFGKKFKDVFCEWSTKIQAVEPLPNRTPAMSKFNRKAATVAARWSRKFPDDMTALDKIHWLTYEAILVRNGVRFTSRGKVPVTYTWIENLATPLLNSIAEVWNQKLNKEIPGFKEPIMEAFAEVWNDYLESIVFSIHECVPSLEPEFIKLLPSFHNLQETVENNVARTLNNLSRAAAKAHPGVTTILREQLTPVFAKALKIRGDGMHQARQDLIQKKIKAGVKEMCLDVMNKLSKDLDAKKEMIPGELYGVASQAIENVKKQVACLLNNLLENDEEGSTVQDRKEALHKNTRKLLLEWESQWRFHRHSGDHILFKDLSIPKDLDAIPVKKEDQEKQMYEWHAELPE